MIPFYLEVRRHPPGTFPLLMILPFKANGTSFRSEKRCLTPFLLWVANFSINYSYQKLLSSNALGELGFAIKSIVVSQRSNSPISTMW